MSIELIDLVDNNGNIAVREVVRNDLDRHPTLYMQIVIAVIFDPQGRVLVQQRSKRKKVNPGDIDHVCGGISSGETPESAAIREAHEETGVRPLNLQIVHHGVNEYDRYRYLLVGNANDQPVVKNPNEVEWAAFIDLDELRHRHKLPSEHEDKLTFVTGFFDDIDRALAPYPR